MKTIRTILATFGATTLLYGVFALVMLGVKPVFAGRTIYQLFRETGFVTLVIGIGCVLSAVIMTVAIISFRDEGSRKKHEVLDEDEELDDFLEEETVPESRAAEADETWSSAMKFKQRRALKQTTESEEDPDDYDEYEDDYEPQPMELKDPYRDRTAETRRFETTQRFVPQPEPQSAPEPKPAPERPVIRSSFRTTGTRESGAWGNPSGFDAHTAPAPAPEAPEPETDPEAEAYAPEASERYDVPASKKCPFCGNLIDTDSTFCIYCGKRV